VIIDEYNTAIKDCITKKCAALKSLYDKRKKWSDAAGNSGDVLKIDLSGIELVNNYSTGAEKDIKEYLQKKIIQAEQRIYILEEEKQVNDMAEKAGLVIDKKEKEGTEKKLNELRKLKNGLNKELTKLK
jgi:3-isopropylmalate dehydratase small subunit